VTEYSASTGTELGNLIDLTLFYSSVTICSMKMSPTWKELKKQNY